jgi:hypothetical protein
MTASGARSKAASRDRLAGVVDRPPEPTSLVGSYFHSGWQQGWQGCVVAEPAPGVYLVERFSWLAGESLDQQLVPIGDMTDWQFYDTAEWMRNTYEHGLKHRWELERLHGDPARIAACPYCDEQGLLHRREGIGRCTHKRPAGEVTVEKLLEADGIGDDSPDAPSPGA